METFFDVVVAITLILAIVAMLVAVTLLILMLAGIIVDEVETAKAVKRYRQEREHD